MPWFRPIWYNFPACFTSVVVAVVVLFCFTNLVQWSLLADVKALSNLQLSCKPSKLALRVSLTEVSHWAKCHPRRPRGSQSGREKRRDESFQARVEEPLLTDSHQTSSKRSTECCLLIGHKKCFILLCPIVEQHLLSSFRSIADDDY